MAHLMLLAVLGELLQVLSVERRQAGLDLPLVVLGQRQLSLQLADLLARDALHRIAAYVARQDARLHPHPRGRNGIVSCE